MDAPVTKTFLRRRKVEEITALSCSMIYRLMAEGKFPKNFPITKGRMAWLADDVLAWQRDRLAEAGKLK